MYRVYLDTCCLNRPFDDQQQPRIHLESEAVLLILKRIEQEEWTGISSEALEYEIEQIPDAERRRRVEILTRHFTEMVALEQGVEERGQELEQLGFDAMDALHIACAEAGAADAFLTTDDRLQRLSLRHSGRLHLPVRNPLAWLQEVIQP